MEKSLNGNLPFTLPFGSDCLRLPNNRNQAVSRAEALEHKGDLCNQENSTHVTCSASGTDYQAGEI